MKFGVENSVFCFLFVLVILLTMAPASQAQHLSPSGSPNIKVEVLSQKEFERKFGNNTDIPRMEQEILSLAHGLYPPAGQHPDAVYLENAEMEASVCREYEVGVLFAALKNPAVSDSVRQQVDKILSASLPSLPKTYTSGHFTFHYTSNDSDERNNMSDLEIMSAASGLNFIWDSWTDDSHKLGFKAPKSYLAEDGTEMIDVYVWYLGAEGWGETDSHWDSINFNSVVLKNGCKRNFILAHELFHRVQYSYGYESGTPNMYWMTEGSALSVNANLGLSKSARRWLVDAKNGLEHPNRDLITTTKRSGNTFCHFWVYLNFFGRTDHHPLKDVWSAYEQNGKNAKKAIGTMVNGSHTLGFYGIKGFDGFFQHWIKANYIKDYEMALATQYLDYMEDEYVYKACNIKYGPMAHVPRQLYTIDSNSSIIEFSGNVAAYGAKYYELNLGSSVTKLVIKIKGSDKGNYSYSFIGIKGNNSFFFSFTDTILNDYTYSRTLSSGQWDKLTLVVAGRSKGGHYTVRVGP